MSFFCDLRVLAKKLASRLATQRKSLCKFNLRPLATTCRSVWPRLKIESSSDKCVFATINQMFGGSSQLPTTAERAVIKSLCTIQTTKQCLAVVVSWEELPNIWLTVVKNAFVGRPLNFRVRMLLKSAVKPITRPFLSLSYLFLLCQKESSHETIWKCVPPTTSF